MLTSSRKFDSACERASCNVWAAIGGAAIGAVGSYASSRNAAKSQGSGPGGSSYTPTDLSGADQGWQQAYGLEQNLVNKAAGNVDPLYLQSLQQQQGINYDPYQQAANRAGQQYDWLSNVSAQQGNQYGQQAQLAGQQQQSMYGVGNQLWQTAQDPQNALYNRTQQQLQEQVRAGQAARGLGNSPIGQGEESQAMSNFNIDWQNQQLSRQMQGAQGMANMNAQGMNQGKMMGADLTGQMASYGAMPGYTQQSAGVPLQSQQMIAGMPAQNAAGYQTNMGQLANMYGGIQQQAIPYMNAGMGAQQVQQQFNANQQAQNARNWGNIGSAVSPTVANWLGGGQQQNTGFNTGTGGSGSWTTDGSQQSGQLNNQWNPGW